MERGPTGFSTGAFLPRLKRAVAVGLQVVEQIPRGLGARARGDGREEDGAGPRFGELLKRAVGERTRPRS